MASLRRGYQRTLRQKLSTAKDYNSWKSTALELDEYLGYDRWKRSSSNAYYDSPLVEEIERKDDVIGIKEVLEVCVRNNFAGIESSRLYSETHFGTKTLIEVYTEEDHFGVIRALLDVRLIPRVVTWNFCWCPHCCLHFFAWVPRLWRTVAQYDTVTWAKNVAVLASAACSCISILLFQSFLKLILIFIFSFFQPRGAPGTPVVHRSGKGWRGGFLLSALEQLLKIELTKNFRVIRDLELLPESGGQSSITIWPKSTFKDWLRILSDPSREELGRMIDVGKRVTWPKLHMIENRLRLERQIVQGREETRDFKTSHNSERRSSPLPNHEFRGADLPLTIPSPPSLEIEEEIAESITDQEGEEGEVTFEKDGRMGSGKKGLGLPRKVKLAVLKADTSTDSEDQWSSEY
ncbi:hypothetical protein DFH28DRAFT_1108765 [Melampsora americana]|nr:hypothetical protein DFH28DRAFT_1108765 [Melampsora americana]